MRIDEVKIKSRGNRLVIFGDSFARIYKHRLQENRWQASLATRLGVAKIVSYAEEGTSLFYSLQALNNYIINDYKKDDVIVFIVTSWTRFPVLHQGVNVNIQSQANTLAYDFGDAEIPMPTYFKENLETLMFLVNNMVTKENHGMYMRCVDAILKSLENKYIILDAFDNSKYYNLHPYDKNNFNLFDVSENEFRLDQSVTDVYLRQDDRVNHLSPVNHLILGKLLYTYFSEDSYTFSVDRFKKGIV